MTLSRKLMIENEVVVASMRTHIKALFLPCVILLATCAAAGFLYASFGGSADGVTGWVILAVAVAVLVVFVIVPFTRWLTWTFTITNKRLIEQRGILTRTGRVIPLSRINDVSFEKNLSDRMLGCGTLIVHDASEQSGLTLHDIPEIEAVHRTLTTLVLEDGRTEYQAGDESV